MLSVLDEDNHLESKIEEDHLWIGVLHDVTLGKGEFVHDADDIVLVDEWCEFDSKVGFGLVHVVEFVVTLEVVDEVLTYHLLALFEECLLSFTSEACNFIAPLLHLLYFADVGHTHEENEEVEEELVL